MNHRLRDSRERLYGSAGEGTKALFHKGFSSVYTLVTIFYTYPEPTLRRRADGGAPAYKIVHASRITSSISRSVTLITNNHPEDPYISENHTRGILWEKLSVAVASSSSSTTPASEAKRCSAPSLPPWSNRHHPRPQEEPCEIRIY